MALSKKELEERRPFIGGSDMPAIMGVSPWKTAWDVWAEKKLDYVPHSSPAAELGNWLENPLLDWFCQVTDTDPLEVERNVRKFREVFTAQYDDLFKSQPIGVEAKTSGLLIPFFRSADFGWGETSLEDPTDKVPLHVIAQTQQQMYVGDLEYVYVPALIANEGRKLYRVNRDEELIKIITECGREFHRRYIAGDEQPEIGDQAPSMILLKSIKREPGKIIQPPKEDHHFFVEWFLSKKKRHDWDNAYQENTAKLLASINNAEGARFPGYLFTYLEQRGADKINLKLLREKYPEVYKEVSTPNFYRVPREKKEETESDGEGKDGK